MCQDGYVRHTVQECCSGVTGCLLVEGDNASSKPDQETKLQLLQRSHGAVQRLRG